VAVRSAQIVVIFRCWLFPERPARQGESHYLR